MEVAIAQDSDEIGRIAADLFEETIRSNPAAVLGLATGSSPLPLYGELIRRHREEGLSFASCRAFTLDEYVGLPLDHPERYRNFIEAEFERHVDFAEGTVQGPDGTASDLAAACAAYETAISDAGGVDIQILGIGSNGHIAFNEPGSSLASRTRAEVLTERTRDDNARFFDGDLSKVPELCVTQGLGTIMEARRIVLIATGTGKAEAVAHLVEGAVSARWPATILQHHADVTVILDDASSTALRLADYYRERWAARHRR